jgi:hypothetical protein
MTFLEVRNTLVSSLAVALGIPVLLSDQVQPEAEVPFIVYSITAPYASTGELGDHTQTVIEDEDGTEALIDNRREQPSATFSFTACSENRWDGEEYIYGDDEAQSITEKAIGYLLQGGYNDLSKGHRRRGGYERREPNNPLIIDEAARRYGFDVRVRYTKDDQRRDDILQSVVTKEEKE